MVDRIISISFYFDPEKFEMLQSLLENPNSFVYFFVNAPMKTTCTSHLNFWQRSYFCLPRKSWPFLNFCFNFSFLISHQCGTNLIFQMVKAGRRVVNISRILHVHLISQYDVKPSISTFSLQVFSSFFFFF